MRLNDSPDTDRRYPLRMPPDWDPPVPAWSSVFPQGARQVSMCVIGCQHDAGQDVSGFVQDLSAIADDADIADYASCEDRDGKRQTVGVLYWLDEAGCADWLESAEFRNFWEKHTADRTEFGVFREVFNIPFQRSETLFSGPEHHHGMSEARTGITGPIKTHMYWGGMRDRIPHSADDPLEASGAITVVEKQANRVRVRAHENLCIIRSGQDWSLTSGEQRREYVETMEPVLKAGMTFLRDSGGEVGCYSCRYMREFDEDGSETDRTFGLAYFRTIGELETWAEHHPTHLAIFNTFLDIAPRHGPDLQLRLWHEVSVLPSDRQFGEYVNCAPGTGLLGGLRGA